ncbi:MAG: arginine--tRNA ligase [Candidatus Colwellbacteria bacterium]|nr:arginine--tRNA ligase [Candidatus Colwellbacteria bacterium]
MLHRIRELIGEKLGDTEFEVLPAESEARGHFSTNAALVYALSLSKSGARVTPLNAAGELKKYLEGKANFFSKIEVAEPGFLNFWVKPEVIREEFEKIMEVKESWGKPEKKPDDTVIIEYSSPNIAKPMHAGHLRSTIIGDALANIYNFLGYKVVRWNYIGDWGTQFGKLIAAYKLWGKKEEVEREPIGTLVDLYIRFHQELKDKPELDKIGQEEFKK